MHLANSLGTRRVADYARELGIKSDLRLDLGLALGDSAWPRPETVHAVEIDPVSGARSRYQQLRASRASARSPCWVATAGLNEG